MYLGVYAESKFQLSDNELSLISNGQRKKRISFDKTVTIKTVYLGTYLLKGKYGWADFYLSKYTPLRIPTRDSDIFIPSITSNYSELINQIKMFSNVEYPE